MRKGGKMRAATPKNATDRLQSDPTEETGSLSAAAFEASPIAILVTDEAGRIVLVNPAAEEVSGYRREELLGQVIECQDKLAQSLIKISDPLFLISEEVMSESNE